MAEAPRFSIREIELYERPVVLRLPFRFGVVTLTECPQAFVRVRIELADGSSAWGAAAELMAPKWFDKNLALTNEDNFEQLRDVLRHGARGLPGATPRPRRAFGHFARHHDAHLHGGGGAGLQPAAGQLRAGAARPRDARRAVPRARRLVLRGDARQPGRHRRGAAASSPASTSSASCAGLQPAAQHRRAPHRRPGRRDHRGRPAASASATACRRRWRRWCASTATATSSSRWAARSRPTWRGWRPSPPCSTAAPQPYFVSLDGNEQYDDAARRRRAGGAASATARRCARLWRLDPVHRAADRAQAGAGRRPARAPTSASR